MRHKYSFITIAVLWILWGWYSIDLASKKVNRAEIYTNSGITHGAVCINSRSVRGVKFYVNYNDGEGVVDDYLILPKEVFCDEIFLEKFNSKLIKISYYKNHYLDVNIDGFIISSLEKSIKNVNDTSSSILFTLFLVVVSTVVLLMRIRGLAKKEAKEKKQ